MSLCQETGETKIVMDYVIMVTNMTEAEATLQRDRVELFMKVRGIEALTDLAARMDVDIRQMHRWLSLESQIRAADVAKMASVLDVSVDYLMGRVDMPQLRQMASPFSDTEIALLAAARDGRRDDAMELLLSLFRRQSSGR
jgi:transcriptional regulator with XRE-family HTH domain